ncbi:MAG: hypothetical protein M3083_01790 [Actinomycetota bacterium]|nr:hypothetical protein [Actinomycetota bacterium]
MEEWKRGIWATLGIALVILALAPIGTWYVVATTSHSAKHGTRSPASAAHLNPLVVAGGIVVLVGMYMVAAGLCDWPLPGRSKARQDLAQLQKVEALKQERLLGLRRRLVQLIADAKVVEARYQASSLEPADESLLVCWTDDARACIANLDAKLLPSFDQQMPPGRFGIGGRPLQHADVIGLLNARASFLADLLEGRSA